MTAALFNDPILESHQMLKQSTVVYLVIAGLLLVAIGGAIFLFPHAFHGSNGIELSDNPNLLSEIRAPGGLLLASGMTMLLGAFRQPLRNVALQLSVLIYGSFGVSRLVSMGIDGMPSSSIVAATLVEAVVAIAGMFVLSRARS